MRQLILRFLALAVVVAGVVAGGWWAWSQLWQRRHPQQAVALQLLADRLGRMTPEQRGLVHTALARDPLAAVLAAESAGWNGLRAFVQDGPDEVLSIQRLALDAGLRGELDGPAAVRFSNAAFAQCAMLREVDPGKGADLLGQLKNLSPEEYRNVGYDASYLMIVPRLDAARRETFRQYQDVLTPMIAAAEPGEWSRLVEKFEKALPRVAGIARDPALGQLYATVYMLHVDQVEALKACGIPDREALDFVGLNAAAIRQLQLEPAVAAEQIKRLRSELGPDGKTSLFQWACRDSAVFWLVAHAQHVSPARREAALADAVKILNHYAGDPVPAILTHYADSDACFLAATDALLRFDNFDSPDPARQRTAARFLSYFQHDPVFKDALAGLGARLIPALSSGRDGKDCKTILAAVVNNRNDLAKYVTPEGRPIGGKPWWTWVPGGNVVYLVDEIRKGKSTDAGDWVWAGVDALVFIPVGRATMLLRLGSRTAAGTGTSVLARESVAVGEEVAARTIGEATWRQTLVLLYDASVRVSRQAVRVGVQAGKWAVHNPVSTSLAATAVFCALYPKEAERIISQGTDWVSRRLEETARKAGRTVVALPGEAIGAIWEKVGQLAARQPMLAPLYYLLAVALTVLVTVTPLAALRVLLPEAFRLLRAWAMMALWPVALLWRLRRRVKV